MQNSDLSDKEFAELDAFLLSDRCPDDAMTMDCLHGFLTALALAPTPPDSAQWLPYVWGGDENEQPKFKNEKEQARLSGMVQRFLAEIDMTLEVALRDYEPLFCEFRQGKKTLLDGEAWCGGFWEGMHLSHTWDMLEASECAPLLRPLYLLGADELEEEELELLDTPEKIHKLSVEAEANLPHILKYCLQRRRIN
ncbi:YecA family protein [Massilia sp. W12]|uniref:YecA/YgfB family protein n=1 Tax=Massilia sp. W12 TaxID=3126507 RepID=UPI0030CF9628